MASEIQCVEATFGGVKVKWPIDSVDNENTPAILTVVSDVVALLDVMQRKNVGNTGVNAVHREGTKISGESSSGQSSVAKNMHGTVSRANICQEVSWCKLADGALIVKKEGITADN